MLQLKTREGTDVGSWISAQNDESELPRLSLHVYTLLNVSVTTYTTRMMCRKIDSNYIVKKCKHRGRPVRTWIHSQLLYLTDLCVTVYQPNTELMIIMPEDFVLPLMTTVMLLANALQCTAHSLSLNLTKNLCFCLVHNSARGRQFISSAFWGAVDSNYNATTITPQHKLYSNPKLL